MGKESPMINRNVGILISEDRMINFHGRYTDVLLTYVLQNPCVIDKDLAFASRTCHEYKNKFDEKSDKLKASCTTQWTKTITDVNNLIGSRKRRQVAAAIGLGGSLALNMINIVETYKVNQKLNHFQVQLEDFLKSNQDTLLSLNNQIVRVATLAKINSESIRDLAFDICNIDLYTKKKYVSIKNRIYVANIYRKIIASSSKFEYGKNSFGYKVYRSC